MIRKGRFAIWNDKEYPIVSQRRKYYLQSEDKKDEEIGFKDLDGRGKLFKEIGLEELQDAYEIFPYAMLAGYRFAIESYEKNTGMVTLVTHNPYAKKLVEVVPYGKDGYKADLPIGSIVISEDRIPILGFG